MRITAIRSTPINVPLEVPYRWSYGAFPGFSKSIIEVETSEGIVGLGEAPTAGATNLIDDAMAARLVGRDPFDITGCHL